MLMGAPPCVSASSYRLERDEEKGPLRGFSGELEFMQIA